MHESHIIMLLAADIRRKKELSGLDEGIVKSNLKEYFEKNKKSLSKLAQYQSDKQLRKSADYELALKAIRANLYQSYGMYKIVSDEPETKQYFLRKLRVRRVTEDDYRKVLSLHLSTKERFEHYPHVYGEIFKITGKPEVILDLGCGLNPLAYRYMPVKISRYIASDIDKGSLEFIQQFFNILGIDGRTVVLDLQNEADIQKLAFIDCDICFMFKLLEIDKRIAEEIVSAVSAKFIAASFSTVSVTGKIMSSPGREWFEKMLKRLKYKFSAFKTENEIFYIIKKS